MHVFRCVSAGVHKAQKRVSDTLQYLSLCDCITVLSSYMIFSRFTSIVANDKISYFFEVEWYSIKYKEYNIFIHLSVEGYLSWWYTLENVNNGANNEQKTYCSSAYSSYCIGIYIQQWDYCTVNFTVNCFGSLSVSYNGCTNLHSHQWSERIFFHNLFQYLVQLEWNSSLCFWFACPWESVMSNIFSHIY